MRLLEGSKKMNQHQAPLYEALNKHIKTDPISFHVPGHKYGAVFQTPKNDFFHSILKIDATELSGLDDLHSPEGAILEAEALLADLYQVDRSFFLVNGSTAGNLAMVMSVCEEGDYVLVQRNCHKSILNALNLAKAHPVFLEPEYDRDGKIASGISLQTVKEAIELYPNAKSVILTYPNYYGMVNDLKGIVTLAHHHHIPVLVDEAHGAHLILGDPMPHSAVQLGADIVVQSAHKTLPAMTMGSYLHFNSKLISIDKLNDYLQIFQSSSPSYPIMASLDLARCYLAAYSRNDLEYLLKEINQFKAELTKIKGIKVLNYAGDPLKVTIQSTCELSGFALQKKIEELGVYTELADPYNVLFVLPLLKENQTYPFKEAINKIKKALSGVALKQAEELIPGNNHKISELALSYKDQEKYKEIEVLIKEATGKVAAEMVIPYPPGIPLLLKGERITPEKIENLNKLLEAGAKFQGSSCLKRGMIKVFRTT
jgi:arginine/lysine/ornithine decarboxylase